MSAFDLEREDEFISFDELLKELRAMEIDELIAFEGENPSNPVDEKMEAKADLYKKYKGD